MTAMAGEMTSGFASSTLAVVLQGTGKVTATEPDSKSGGQAEMSGWLYFKGESTPPCHAGPPFQHGALASHHPHLQLQAASPYEKGSCLSTPFPAHLPVFQGSVVADSVTSANLLRLPELPVSLPSPEMGGGFPLWGNLSGR